VDDDCIGFKEVNSKKQARLPDEVIEELDIEINDENKNGVAFYQNNIEGEIILRGLAL
jgi:hypothetical protein